VLRDLQMFADDSVELAMPAGTASNWRVVQTLQPGVSLTQPHKKKK